MSAESRAVAVPLPGPVALAATRLRADRPGWSWLDNRWELVRGSAVLVLGVVFVLLGGGGLDLGPVEARLGLAAREPFGPLGIVFGSWDPSIWPLPLAFSRVWATLGRETTGAVVRWPAAIAGIAAGFVLTRRMARVLGAWASVLLGFCWFGSLALIDRSGGAGIDLLVGLGTIAALDRILNSGSDAIAGLWASLAFLAGGWTPLAVIALVSVVIGRQTTGLTRNLIVPPLITIVTWSAWTLSRAQAEAWGAGVALPLTEKSAWFLAPGVLVLALPWSPLCLLITSRSVRSGWTAGGNSLVMGWLQVALACLLVGTVVPGLAGAARMPALAGLAVVAAACADRVRLETVLPQARRGFLTIMAAIVGLWVTLVLGAGIFLASAVPFYRLVAIFLIIAALGTGLIALNALFRSDTRRGLIALCLVALSVKIAHLGYYVPEWNYRRSEGPWGRAIGQWVVPGWPIYTLHTWNPALAFATEHPVRQLRQPKSLAFQESPTPRFLLLLAGEFEHWPEDAPPIVKVATLQDQRGATRVVARMAGPFSWSELVNGPRDNEDSQP